MRRWMMLIVLVIAVLMLLPVPAQAARDTRPTIVVAPVIITENEFPEISQLTISKVYEAFERMGFRVIAGPEVERAMRELGYPVYGSGLLHQSIGTPVPPAAPGEPLVSTYLPVRNPANVVLNPEALLAIGRYFNTDMAAGVVFPIIRFKYSQHFPEGKRPNGRCKLILHVVDAKREQILYEYSLPENEEFGVSDLSQKDTRTIVAVVGGLLAGGVMGKGRTTRTLGWAALAAPQFIGRGGDKAKLAFAAVVKGINESFGDFYQRYHWENAPIR